MPNTNEAPQEFQSEMLGVVIDYLTVKTVDRSVEKLGMELKLTPSWIRAIREGRSTRPDINRIEYIFRNFCGGKVEVSKAE